MTTLALLPIHLTKAFVRGHLRNLGGRMVEVKPYHTKTQPKRDDDRTRELFGDIPPAGNQIQPRMHPARTTKPRAPVIPFKAALPQLFEEKEVETVQNGQYNKDTKGRNPAPATEGTKMDETNKAATPATARNPIGTAKAGWLSKLARYIDAAGNTVEGRQLAHLRKLVNGIDTGTLSGGQNAETEFKQAVHRAIDASGDETVYHNALRLIAFYNKNPPITKEEQHARAKAFHEAEQAAKAKAEQAKADRIYLTVPFADKDKMKSKGAKWDGDRKKWYWPTSAGDMPAVVKGYAK